jgi:hypothetical protein
MKEKIDYYCDAAFKFEIEWFNVQKIKEQFLKDIRNAQKINQKLLIKNKN